MNTNRKHVQKSRSDRVVKDRLRFLTRLRNRYLITFDVIGLAIIPTLAMMLRIDDPGVLSSYGTTLLVYTVVMLCAKIFAFQVVGLYSELWVYASVHELVVVVRAIAVGAIVEGVIFFGVFLPLHIPSGWIPRSIPMISSILTAFWISGSRLGIRILFTLVSRPESASHLRPVLIAGAGIAGALAVKELQNNMQLGIEPIGFVDDDPSKLGKRIHGVPVFGRLQDIPRIVRERKISEVIIAMPAVSGKVVREVVQLCREVKVPSKTIPAIFDIVSGAARIDDVRSVQLEDLLRRGVIETDTTPLLLLLRGARVLVTGAGGSIGSELCRQIRGFRPVEMILVGHGETSIYEMMKELGELPAPGMRITPVIADIRDQERMDQVFRALRPDVVFHAAAHKHVHLMQENTTEAVTNNVLGTRTLVQLSERYDVRRFVMVSSDKAVNPTSVMGVTKRIAELIVQDAANQSGKAFVTVRFGNVLGSRGSVVPVFKRQIAMGGPVTVTDPEVTRYFMTIPEAVQLVLQAATMGEGGELFVLDMGEQIKVIDMARDLIRLSGYTEEEIEIKITGMLPGEKMYEELFYETDRVEQTSHAKILVCRRNYARDLLAKGRNDTAGKQKKPNKSSLQTHVTKLIEAAQEGKVADVTRTFHELVPQYCPTFGEDTEHHGKKPTSKEGTQGSVRSHLR
jgi:FlaA1/EpsC-like NDP-sugar epimerase